MALQPSLMTRAGDLRDCLARRQLPGGGWAALPSTSQASLECTALSYLAVASNPAQDEARTFLLGVQNPNGSWPAFTGDDKEGSWTTSLALIALHEDFQAIVQRMKGFAWLARSAGEESHWLWKWKFRTTDRHVRFDPDKFGWPWIPGTNSWVVPTAFAIIALRRLPCGCGPNNAGRRVDVGIQMLLDRACPGGGWNAGNGIVYGNAMAPHPDDTAIALLALSPQAREPILTTSVDWLERVAPEVRAPWSLAWSILALAAHHRPVDSLLTQLSCWPGLDETDDTSTLAVISLALDHEQTLVRFGIAV
jgi:hypothetical protein